jgi:dienelactone hydrolase
MTAFECFEVYDRRFLGAMAAMPARRPWLPEDQREIVAIVRNCLGIREEWIPAITACTVGGCTASGGMRIEYLRSSSWNGVIGTAHLYLPPGQDRGPRPFVLLCCGHGARCKLDPAYQAMARAIARLGAIVLVPDNIGQGERSPMGHSDCVTPFACGTSVQGLIVMETIGWLRWARRDNRVDPRRMAAIGNSGGGTLTLLLGALCPELAALSSSGYPCTFEYVARKEKKHCHCNILPGFVGQVEMWQVLGCFAPKPLCIFQGEGDPMFPCDLFHAVARKVKHVYRTLEAETSFRASVVSGGHSWDHARIHLLTRFLQEALHLPDAAPASEQSCLPESDGLCLETWPAHAITTDDLARRITGRMVPADLHLWDVFPPELLPERPDEQLDRGDVRQILSQFEAFLKKT